MAGYNRARYQYETSPRKLEPEYRQPQKRYPKKSTTRKTSKNTQARQSQQLQSKYKAIAYVAIFFAVLFAMSYRNTVISEKYSQIKEMKSSLATIEKKNEQLEVNIESKTNLGAIEKEAKSKLDMKKLDDDQTIYVALDKQDYIESAIDDVVVKEDNLNIFQKIIQKIQNIF